MKTEALRGAELFRGLPDEQAARLLAIAEPVSVREGQYLFLLGDSAERLYVSLVGTIELCMPLSFSGTIKDVCVDSQRPGSAIGWSALVHPYRFTLSARAAEKCELAAFSRHGLETLFAADPALGLAFMRVLTEIVGRRLHQFQALWFREVQRSVTTQIEEKGGSAAAGLS